MIIDENIKSVLRLKSIIMKKIEFDRNDNFIDSEKLLFKVGYNIKHLEENINNYEISLRALIESSEKETFRLFIELVGCFSFNSENLQMKNKEILIQKNTLAILFPYLRSQVTLITSQPGMEPIIIPPININSLIEQDKNELM
jgi:preprotein translocase subunit SecB